MLGEFKLNKNNNRIIAIGDLHGDIIQLLAILKDSNLIKMKKNRSCLHKEDYKIDNWKWTGGSSYVVQMGDIFDGGGRKEIDEFEDNEVEILIFLIKLKKLAKKDGGNVLLIFGNHEYMNFLGEYKYVQKKTLNKCLKGNNINNLEYKIENKICNDRDLLFKLGNEGIMAKLMSEYSYGVIKIGENIFCHGGINNNISENYSINKINILLRKFLLNKLEKEDINDFNNIYKDNGIIWYRGYMSNNNNNCEELNKVLKKMDGKRMIVGHTVQINGISTKCKKYARHLYGIDVGLSRAFNTKIKCQYLEIKWKCKPKIRECNIYTEC